MITIYTIWMLVLNASYIAPRHVLVSSPWDLCRELENHKYASVYRMDFQANENVIGGRVNLETSLVKREEIVCQKPEVAP